MPPLRPPPPPLRIKEQNPNNKINKGEQREGQKGIRNKVIVRLKFPFVDKSGKLFTKNELGRLTIKWQWINLYVIVTWGKIIL